MKIKSKIFIIILIFIFQHILLLFDFNVTCGFLVFYSLFLFLLFIIKSINKYFYYKTSCVNEQKLKKILLFCVKNECFTEKFNEIIKNLLKYFLKQNILYDYNYKFNKDENFENIEIQDDKFKFTVKYEKKIKENDNYKITYDYEFNIDPYQNPLNIIGKLNKNCQKEKNIYNYNNLNYKGKIKNFDFQCDEKNKSNTISIKKGKIFDVEGNFEKGELTNGKIKIKKINKNEDEKLFEGYLENGKLTELVNNGLILEDEDKNYDFNKAKENKNLIMNDD